MEDVVGILKVRIVKGTDLAVRDLKSSDPYVVVSLGHQVRIVKGTDLAVRDLRSSDPYVVASLGHQKVKTRAIKQDLNPIWDEELSLSIPQSNPLLLKLEVFDKDRLSRDDKMGNCEVDLEDLASAVKMRKTNPSSPMLQTKDSSSCIKCVDGHLVKEVSLRLQNVESGQLEVHIKWLDFTE